MQYGLKVLGYRAERTLKNTPVDKNKRINILYDHLQHKKSIRDLIRDHAINYSTLRHILAQYYLFGKTEARKFKDKGGQSRLLINQHNFNNDQNQLKSDNKQTVVVVNNNMVQTVPPIKNKETDGTKVTLEF